MHTIIVYPICILLFLGAKAPLSLACVSQSDRAKKFENSNKLQQVAIDKWQVTINKWQETSGKWQEASNKWQVKETSGKWQETIR